MRNRGKDRRGSSRLSYANVAATAALALAVGGGTVALGGAIDEEGEIQACFDKKGRGQGDLRLLVKGRCAKGERSIAWNQEGPRGPEGPAGTVGADGAPGSGAEVDAFTKAESDARFLRTSPRHVVVRADGTPAENGQALRAALASLPAAASLTDRAAVELTTGAFALSASPLVVPPGVTLRGAGRRATFMDGQVVLGDGGTLEDLAIFSASGAGPAAIQVTGGGALVERVEAAWQNDVTAEALRVDSGGDVVVRDSSLTAAGSGAGADVRAVNASGLTRLVDTDVAGFSGSDEMRGVLVGTGGILDMVGGKIEVDDNDTPGTTPVGLRLAGGGSTIRETDIEVFSGSQPVNGVEVATANSSLSGVTVRASSSGADTALEASSDVTVETSELVATGTGDVGVETIGVTTDVRVGASRVSAPTTAAGGGSEICAFSYSNAFAALSATCQ